MSIARTIDALIDHATGRYRRAGRFAFHWGRGKLRHDPVFVEILARGLLNGRRTILDLGCGQGLLAAWLRSAAQAAVPWPAHWPPPPQPQRIVGIDLMPADVRRARHALAGDAEFTVGDIRTAPFESAEAVVILDVLHYIEVEAQLAVLHRVRATLPADGVLVTRIGNAAGGFGFRFSTWVDRAVMRARGIRNPRLHTHSLEQWQSMLRQCGFDSEAFPIDDGRFANVLLVARPR